MSKISESKIGITIYNHITNNKREYLIATILFLIGLIVGVFFVNNAGEIKIETINKYINDLCSDVSKYTNIDLFALFRKSILKDIIIVLILWFGASTIIGIPIVYGMIIFKGFTLGYTISSILTVIGVWKGILFALALLLFHNIIFIPTILAISVSGVKLYKSIMKNKNRENIKFEILRHTMFCLIMLVLLAIASVIETYISTNLFIILLKYIKI